MSFNLQTTRVRHQTFPVGTKDPVPKTPKSASHPVSQPKPNVAKQVTSHSTPVTRNIVKTHSGCVNL